MVKIIRYVFLCLTLFLTGCQNTLNDNAEQNDTQREYILRKVKNYQGLIQLYHDRLRRKEDAQTRYKLAECYHLLEDYESSRHYLQPLLISQPDEATLLLESRNLLEQNNTQEALTIINQVQLENPGSGEAYNLQGILLARNGNFSGAQQAFNQARLRFVDDDIIINNLAMLAIMQEDYAAARNYLIPLYSRGNSNKKIRYNLAFVLVKLQDVNGAENILRQENISSSHREGLLESLAQIRPRSQQQLQQKSVASEALFSEAKKAMFVPQVSVPTNPVLPVATTEPSSHVTPVIALPQSLSDAQPANKSTFVSQVNSTPVEGSLAATGKVFTIRAGQHQKYFRLTLESVQAINFRELKSTKKNKRLFELYNVKLDGNLQQLSEKIPRNHRNIRKLTFHQKDIDTVLLDFEFKYPISKTNIFRLPTTGKVSPERLVFDLFH